MSVNDVSEERRHNHRSYQVVMCSSGSIESKSVQNHNEERDDTKCLPMDSEHLWQVSGDVWVLPASL